MRTYRIALLFGVGVLVATVFAAPAQPSSRILWNNNGQYVLVGRNMDWFEDMKSNIWALPRGVKRDGLAATNPLTWTSKFGSVVITGYESVTVDGNNEKGLACHFLYLPETKTGTRDGKVPGLTISLWAQYYLDNYATVAEAVKDFEKQPYQLIMAIEPLSHKPATVRLSLDDASGDTAILECIDGKIKVYHNRDYIVMASQPTFDKQLEKLRVYRGFGGEKSLPSLDEPADRFTRAAFYARNLPKPKSNRDAATAMLGVMRTVAAPVGIADPKQPNDYTTIWRTVTDLTSGVLYYDSATSPQVFWIDTRKLDFAEGQPVKKLTVVNNLSLAGDVSDKFQQTEMFKFLGPEK